MALNAIYKRLSHLRFSATTSSLNSKTYILVYTLYFQTLQGQNGTADLFSKTLLAISLSHLLAIVLPVVTSPNSVVILTLSDTASQSCSTDCLCPFQNISTSHLFYCCSLIPGLHHLSLRLLPPPPQCSPCFGLNVLPVHSPLSHPCWHLSSDL